MIINTKTSDLDFPLKLIFNRKFDFVIIIYMLWIIFSIYAIFKDERKSVFVLALISIFFSIYFIFKLLTTKIIVYEDKIVESSFFGKTTILFNQVTSLFFYNNSAVNVKTKGIVLLRKEIRITSEYGLEERTKAVEYILNYFKDTNVKIKRYEDLKWYQ